MASRDVFVLIWVINDDDRSNLGVYATLDLAKNAAVTHEPSGDWVQGNDLWRRDEWIIERHDWVED